LGWQLGRSLRRGVIPLHGARHEYETFSVTPLHGPMCRSGFGLHGYLRRDPRRVILRGSSAGGMAPFMACVVPLGVKVPEMPRVSAHGGRAGPVCGPDSRGADRWPRGVGALHFLFALRLHRPVPKGEACGEAVGRHKLRARVPGAAPAASPYYIIGAKPAGHRWRQRALEGGRSTTSRPPPGLNHCTAPRSACLRTRTPNITTKLTWI